MGWAITLSGDSLLGGLMVVIIRGFLFKIYFFLLCLYVMLCLYLCLYIVRVGFILNCLGFNGGKIKNTKKIQKNKNAKKNVNRL